MMEFFETDIKMSDLYRKYNVSQGTFSKLKSRFIEGGKRSIEAHGSSEIILHRRETDKLKTIITEQVIVIEELKKSWEGRTR